MRTHRPINAIIPGFGQRSVKTALAASLIALLYLPFHEDPTFACIGVIFGMGADRDESRLHGGNRLFGTIIGGVIALLLYSIEHYFFPDGAYYLRVILLFVGILILVCASVALRFPGAVHPGGVILCIILFNTPPDHVSYSVHRMVNTAIGVIFALFINELITRERVEAWFGHSATAEPTDHENGISS